MIPTVGDVLGQLIEKKFGNRNKNLKVIDQNELLEIENKKKEQESDVERFRKALIERNQQLEKLQFDYYKELEKLRNENEKLRADYNAEVEETKFLKEKDFHATEFIKNREQEKDDLKNKVKELEGEKASLVSANEKLENRINELEIELEEKGTSNISFNKKISLWIEALEEAKLEDFQNSKEEMEFFYILVRNIMKQVAPEFIESAFHHDETASVFAQLKFERYKIEQKMIEIEQNSALSETSKSLLVKNLETSLEKILSLLNLE